MAKTYEVEIGQLIPDDKNFNRGTDEGKKLIRKSLHDFGAGRSVLIDKDNRIIAGNKTHENADAADIKKVIVVETDGTELVAVKRTDIGIDTKEGRELALADNATAHVNLEWDVDELTEAADDYGINLDDWGVDFTRDDENPYTQKVESPVYTATEEKQPEINELIDTSKRDELAEKISASNIPQDIKEFLFLAAMRHVVFHYDRIAEYYCHASEDVQRLMEDSALVIIDFDDAIGGGYVKAKMELETEFADEYGDR